MACPVCINVFKRPTTLPCGHTFCYSCLLNATREHRQCPICRQHIDTYLLLHIVRPAS
ncbi:MAG: hypothetical protein KDD45_01460 [Bdellovibrionales bacterium]|nr:hypothetical protein [Bdellovibrionales bacterium]